MWLFHVKSSIIKWWCGILFLAWAQSPATPHQNKTKQNTQNRLKPTYNLVFSATHGKIDVKFFDIISLTIENFLQTPIEKIV